MSLAHLVTENSENQLRQYTDAAAVFGAYSRAAREAATVRGSMFWRELRGVNTLIRTSTAGAQRSLGPESEQTKAIYASFIKRKEHVEQSKKSLSVKLDEMRKLNKVYGVGRTPQVVVSLLQSMEKAGIGEQFLTVGTHALYAYESACGIRVRSDPLQTAVNDDGFEIDLIRRTAIDGDPHPLPMSAKAEDFWAVQVASGNQLVSGRKFEQMVVSPRGDMALMRTVHPLDFVRVKTSMAASPQRDPLKRPKDALQAEIVQRLWDEYLVHLHHG